MKIVVIPIVFERIALPPRNDYNKNNINNFLKLHFTISLSYSNANLSKRQFVLGRLTIYYNDLNSIYIILSAREELWATHG